MIFKMNRENIKLANELVKEVKELEALIPYIDNCLSQGIDGFNDSKFNEIKIVLTSSVYQTREIQQFIPQLMPVIAIMAKDEIRKLITEKETEIESL